MARMKPETSQALADAYAELLREGKPVTVRALRDSAGVGTNAAAEWLRETKPDKAAPPFPIDQLKNGLDGFWGLAIRAARDEVATEHNEALHAARDGETEALSQVEGAATRIAELEAELVESQTAHSTAIAELQAQLDAASMKIGELTDRAEKDATLVQDSINRAVRAETTAETLQKLVDQHITGGNEKSANGATDTR